jgi:hypothetical protein
VRGVFAAAKLEPEARDAFRGVGRRFRRCHPETKGFRDCQQCVLLAFRATGALMSPLPRVVCGIWGLCLSTANAR